MTRREWQQLAVLLLTAALGVLAVGIAFGGEVGVALVYGAALSAIAGGVCLVLEALARPG